MIEPWNKFHYSLPYKESDPSLTSRCYVGSYATNSGVRSSAASWEVVKNVAWPQHGSLDKKWSPGWICTLQKVVICDPHPSSTAPSSLPQSPHSLFPPFHLKAHYLPTRRFIQSALLPFLFLSLSSLIPPSCPCMLDLKGHCSRLGKLFIVQA